MQKGHQAVGVDYLNTDISISLSSFYNIIEFLPGVVPSQKIIRYDKKKILTIEHDDTQKRFIKNRMRIDGKNEQHLIKLLGQVPMKKFLRKSYYN